MANSERTPQRKAKGCKLTYEEREARLHFAVRVIASTPSKYEQATILKNKYGITRRAAVNILARARARLRMDREEDAESLLDLAHRTIREAMHAAMGDKKYRAALKAAELAIEIGQAGGAAEENLFGGVSFEIVDGARIDGGGGAENPDSADGQSQAGGVAGQPGS